MREPSMADQSLLVSLDARHDARRLEVPQDEVAERVARGEVAAVWRELRLAGVTG